MRQVIRRFLKHLDAEKNASATTIETYRYDLRKFQAKSGLPTRRTDEPLFVIKLAFLYYRYRQRDT